MKSIKNPLVIILALALVGAAGWAWKVQQELDALKATSMSPQEQADLRQRLANAEKRAKQLSDSLSVAQSGNPGNAQRGFPRGGPGQVTINANGGSIRGPMGFMNNPEIQKMMAANQKAGLDTNYAALFKSLKLSPEKLDALKNLLVDKQTVPMDVMSAASQQGLDMMKDGPALRQSMLDAQAEVDAQIKTLLGDQGYAEYQNYQQTLPQRGIANRLQQSLSYTSTPLSDDQASQLIQILAQNPGANPMAKLGGDATYSGNTVVFSGRGAAVGGGATTTVTVGGPGIVLGGAALGGGLISDAAVTQAQTILSPPQVQALQQLQHMQQTEAQAGLKMIQGLGAASAAPKAGAAPGSDGG